MSGYEDCIVFILAKASQHAQGVFKKRLLSFGLTPIQYLILEALSQTDGLSAGEIGDRLTLDRATLSGVLDRLTEKGLIHKDVEARDRRQLRVTLSRKADALMPALLAEREAANEALLTGFSLEEKLLLKRMLKDVYR